MEQYQVSARKYRPSTFDAVVGQKSLTSTLKNAVKSGKLAHSYLFCGSRGVGKTSCARIFAKTINCQNPTPDGEACNECTSCREFNAGSSMNIIELDAASNNSVDDIRRLVEQVSIPPSNGRYKVFIVDEVHMLSSGAFNAFLKTLEEPPSYVIFILATTEKNKILPTILSRCQIYDFHRITIQDIVDHLSYVAAQEGIQAEKNALGVIATQADGAMRDALSIFDQVAASSAGNITYSSTLDSLNVLDRSYYIRLMDAFMAGDVVGSWLIYKEIRDRGFDSHFFIGGLGTFMRDLMVAMSPSTISLLEADDDTRTQMAELARKIDPALLTKGIRLMSQADLDYRQASNKQFLIEVALAKLCQPCSPSDSDDNGESEGLKPINAISDNNAPTAPAVPVSTPAAATTSTTHTPPSVTSKAPGITPAPAAPRRMAAGPGISIRPSHSAAPATDTPAVSQQAPSTVHDQPFTIEQVNTAWEAFISAHPSEKILINTMRAGGIQITGDNTLTTTVQSPLQQELVSENMPRIIEFLRSQLSNDHVTLQVTVNQGEAAPHTWNEREILAHLVDESPQVRQFIERYDLKLL